MKKIVKFMLCTLMVLALCSFVAPSGTGPIYPAEGYVGVSTTGDYTMLGVAGYTGDGVYYEDNIRDHESGIWGNDEFYLGAECYEYYLDTDGQWWRCDIETRRWQKWINVLGWHWSEVLYHEEPSNIAQQMYKDNPTLSLDGSTTLVVAMASLAALAGIAKVYFGKRRSLVVKSVS